MPGSHMAFYKEMLRKTIHLGALIIPVGYYFLDRDIALVILGIGAGVSLVIDIFQLHVPYLGFLLRKHENRGKLTGATYMALGSFLTILFFDKAIALTSLLFAILCDAAAALIGKRFGKHKIWHNKSVEGSLAFFVMGLFISKFTPIGILGSIVATVSELFSDYIDDNLLIPLASGLAMTLYAATL